MVTTKMWTERLFKLVATVQKLGGSIDGTITFWFSGTQVILDRVEIYQTGGIWVCYINNCPVPMSPQLTRGGKY